MTKARIIGLGFVLVLSLLAWTGTALAEESARLPETAVTPAVDIPQATLPAEQTPDIEGFLRSLEPAKSLQNWPGECPAGSPPVCTHPSQCDDWCGGPGFGACGPFLCCLCAG